MRAINFKNSVFELDPNLNLYMQLAQPVSITSIKKNDHMLQLIHNSNTSSLQLKLRDLLKVINSINFDFKIIIIDNENNHHASFGYYLRDSDLVIK
ncbi:hypothetical protein AYR57_08315 [Pediococcus claussenii]|nr:hypothetical protein AYR57_08315 [Pediococcus claussenii]ANZ72135.1 hypothetical protein AYR58_08315 [Pediococcus claussenii]